MIIKRARFFLAVEGQSEGSFVRWLQMLSDNGLHVYLDTYLLNGGGFKSMLAQTVRFHKKGVVTKGSYHDRFLLVDSDRSESGDWSIEELRREAAQHQFTVCLQRPKYEAVLLRMMPGMDTLQVEASSAERQLISVWPTYQKPVDARSLARRFTLNDLLRMAHSDPDFRNLLQKIGLMGQ